MFKGKGGGREGGRGVVEQVGAPSPSLDPPRDINRSSVVYSFRFVLFW